MCKRREKERTNLLDENECYMLNDMFKINHQAEAKNSYVNISYDMFKIDDDKEVKTIFVNKVEPEGEMGHMDRGETIVKNDEKLESNDGTIMKGDKMLESNDEIGIYNNDNVVIDKVSADSRRRIKYRNHSVWRRRKKYILSTSDRKC